MRCRVNAFICNYQTISPPTKIFKNPQLYTTNEKNFHERQLAKIRRQRCEKRLKTNKGAEFESDSLINDEETALQKSRDFTEVCLVRDKFMQPTAVTTKTTTPTSTTLQSSQL